jgi:translation initiation factor IF-3
LIDNFKYTQTKQILFAMADTGIPIVIGMRILVRGRQLAQQKGRSDLLAKFDKSIEQLKAYEKKGHGTMDDRAGSIISTPFKGEFALEEEAHATIDISELAEPAGEDED